MSDVVWFKITCSMFVLNSGLRILIPIFKRQRVHPCDVGIFSATVTGLLWSFGLFN